MQIYNYKQTTGEYIGSIDAALDPLSSTSKKEIPLIPAHATVLPPPKSVADNVAVFNVVTNKWSNQPDNRGTVYHVVTGGAQQYDKLGSLPAELTRLKPGQFDSWNAVKGAWGLDVAKVCAARITQINADYQTALNAGVTYSGSQYQSDAASISALAETLTAVSNGWVLPTGFAWIDAADVPHAADAGFLKGLSSAFADHKAALFVRLQAAKAAIAAAKSEAAVNKVAL